MVRNLSHKRACAVSSVCMRCSIDVLICSTGVQHLLYLSSLSLCLVLIEKVCRGQVRGHEARSQHLRHPPRPPRLGDHCPHQAILTCRLIGA
jgi:hypothetical protein